MVTTETARHWELVLRHVSGTRSRLVLDDGLSGLGDLVRTSMVATAKLQALPTPAPDASASALQAFVHALAQVGDVDMILAADMLTPDICLAAFELLWPTLPAHALFWARIGGPNNTPGPADALLGATLLNAHTALASDNEDAPASKQSPVSQTLGLLTVQNAFNSLRGVQVSIRLCGDTALAAFGGREAQEWLSAQTDSSLLGPCLFSSPPSCSRPRSPGPQELEATTPVYRSHQNAALLAREREEVERLRSSGATPLDMETAAHAIHSRQYLRIKPAVARQLALLGGGDVELVIPRHTLLLDVTDQGSAHTIACMESGQLEPLELEIFQDILARNPGALVLDVGANYGVYTLSACELARHGLVSGIIAVEPDPAVAETLRRSLVRNGYAGLAVVHNVAAHHQDNASLDFFVNAAGSVDSRVGQDGGVPVRETLRVQGRTLDSLAREWAPRRPAAGIVVKMDIQGHEPIALAGMRDMLSSGEPLALLVEVAPALLEAMDITLDSFAQELWAWGFNHCLDINEENGLVTPLASREELLALLVRLRKARGFERRYTNLACIRGMRPPESWKRSAERLAGTGAEQGRMDT